MNAKALGTWLLVIGLVVAGIAGVVYEKNTMNDYERAIFELEQAAERIRIAGTGVRWRNPEIDMEETRSKAEIFFFAGLILAAVGGAVNVSAKPAATPEPAAATQNPPESGGTAP